MNGPLRVLIVDDEPFVRKKIRSFPLEEHGYFVVGEADNGVAALELARRLRPHIVVADIGMPVMNGLELLRLLRERPFPPEVMMLTCYEQFDKVQSALRYGAADYVTKLLFKEADFLDALDRVAAKAREAERIQLQTAKEWLSAYCAASSSESPEFATAGLAEFMPLGSAVVAVLRAAADSADWLAERAADMNGSEGPDGRAAKLAVRLDRDAWACVFYRQRRCMPESLESEAEAILDGFLRTVPGDRKIRAFLSGEFHAWRSLSEVVRLSLAAADEALFFPVNARFRLGSTPCRVAPREELVPPPPTEDRLSSLPRTEAAELLRAWMSSLGESGPCASWSTVRAALPRLLCAVVRSEAAPPPLECFAEASERLRGAFDRSELIGTVDRLLDDWEHCALPDAAESGTRSEVRKAIEYIHCHYDQELSLPAVARRVNLSASWFASLFRAEIGKPFTEYVQSFRLRQARRLLSETELKVYEVAGAVGIPNARYFSRIFYEAFGMTPLEFRKGETV